MQQGGYRGHRDDVAYSNAANVCTPCSRINTHGHATGASEMRLQVLQTRLEYSRRLHPGRVEYGRRVCMTWGSCIETTYRENTDSQANYSVECIGA
jgi:hypothetical protein